MSFQDDNNNNNNNGERRKPFLVKALESSGDIEMLICANTGRVWIGDRSENQNSLENYIPTRIFIDLETGKIKPKYIPDDQRGNYNRH